MSTSDHGNQLQNFEKGNQLTWTTTLCVTNFKFVYSFLIFNKLTKHSQWIEGCIIMLIIWFCYKRQWCREDTLNFLLTIFLYFFIEIVDVYGMIRSYIHCGFPEENKIQFILVLELLNLACWLYTRCWRAISSKYV